MRRPLVISFIVYSLGIIMSRYFSGSFSFVVFTLLFILYLFGVGFYKIPKTYGIFLLILVAAFGYYQVREAMIPEVSWIQEKGNVIEGQITDFPRENEKGYAVEVTSTKINGEEVKAKILAYVAKDTRVHYGNEVKIFATYMAPQEVKNPGGFSFDEYLYNNNIDGTIYVGEEGSILLTGKGQKSLVMASASRLRDSFEEAIYPLSQNQKAFLKGVFLGDTRGLTQNQLDLLTQSGIRHCFSVSGMHVGYLVLFLSWFFSVLKIPKQRMIFFLFPTLLLYCGMTGFQPAVVRASLMCLLLFFSQISGRQVDGYTSLALAGFIITLWNPNAFWLIGVQMSFLAMFSIIYFTPYLKKMISKDFTGRDALCFTLAAQLFMIPLVAYSFHVVSLMSFFVNTIVCLFVGGVVILAFIGTVLASVFGSLFFYASGLIGDMVLFAMAAVAKLPLAYFYCDDFPLWILFGICAILIVIPKIPRLRFRPFVAFGIMILSLGLLFLPFHHLYNQPMEVTFLSVGPKDCAYIETPNGKNILIDAGADIHGETAVYSIRPFLLSHGVNTIDYIFLSHSDLDHAGGIPSLIEFFHVKNLVVCECDHYYNTELLAFAQEKGTQVISVSKGDYARIGGVDFTVIYPEKESQGDANAISMVLKVVYQDFSLLFTGDAPSEVLEHLVKEGEDLKADVLKIPHHGSKSGISESFYEAVSPDAAVISVGKNSYGHPDKGVIEALNRQKITWFRTDQSGAVTFRSDGKAYEVTTFLQ